MFLAKNVVKNNVSWCILIPYTLWIWFQSHLKTFLFNSSKNGLFLAKLKMFWGGFHHLLHLPTIYPSGFKEKITIGKKSSLTSKVKRGEQWYILSFLSKKCIFRAEKGIFSKSSFYTKMFSDQKYSFSVRQKKYFVLQSKVNIFHQIQPKHVPSSFICMMIPT